MPKSETSAPGSVTKSALTERANKVLLLLLGAIESDVAAGMVDRAQMCAATYEALCRAELARHS